GLAVDHVIRVWEAATGKERRRFQGHRGPICSVAFAPYGKLLASGSEDTSVLLWGLTGRVRKDKPIIPLAGKQMKELWQQLLQEDATIAFRPIQALTRAPDQTAPFLQKHLSSRSGVDAKQTARWIKDRDSEEFAARQKATKELQKLG